MQKALKAFRTHLVQEKQGLCVVEFELTRICQKGIESVGGKMSVLWIKITFPFCNADAVLWHSSGNFHLNLELSADLNNMPAVFVLTSFEVKVCLFLCFKVKVRINQLFILTQKGNFHSKVQIYEAPTKQWSAKSFPHFYKKLLNKNKPILPSGGSCWI